MDALRFITEIETVNRNDAITATPVLAIRKNPKKGAWVISWNISLDFHGAVHARVYRIGIIEYPGVVEDPGP